MTLATWLKRGTMYPKKVQCKKKKSIIYTEMCKYSEWETTGFHRGFICDLNSEVGGLS